jgi:DnaK suppressor protein
MELRRARRVLDGIAVVRSADDLEEAQYRSDRELAIAHLDHYSHIERGLITGLRRIHDGTFGACASCGGEIGGRRLNAVPWTPLCIRCQEACEAGLLEDADTFFPDAA